MTCKIKKLPHTKRVYKEKKRGGSQHYWTGRKPQTRKGTGLRRKDFSYTYGSQGYMIQYKGKNIGGAGTLPRDKPAHWRHRRANLKDNKQYAESTINQILDGNAGRMFSEAIRKIDSYQRPKKQYYNGRHPGKKPTRKTNRSSGKIKGWRRSKHHARPTTKMAWESIDRTIIAIDYVPSSNIPYKIIINDMFRIDSGGNMVGYDSTGTLARAKKLASRFMREHPNG